MTEKDFRQLKDLRTPEEWIENTLLIPQKKNKPPFLFRPSVIGAAASLLIIATAALTLFLNLRQLPEPTTQTVFQTVTPTDTSATTTETVQATPPSTMQPTAVSSSPSTAAVMQTPSSSQSAQAVSPSGSSNSSSTPLPTVKPTVAPTASPTVKPTGSPTVPPTVKPTTVPTEPATYSTQPLTAPTEIKPTVPATVPATLPKEEELYYMGRFIFHAGQGSVFADSASVSVTLSQSGYAYSNLTVPLRSDGTGKKRGVLPVYEEAILLYTDSACTVTVSGDGHRVSKTVFLTFGNDVIINL
ncbi:MAG: hypothetical protein II224_03670 [Ruminococcus sp.]|nr:hypothetical protein [Ruminococcus sp.]